MSQEHDQEMTEEQFSKYALAVINSMPKRGQTLNQLLQRKATMAMSIIHHNSFDTEGELYLKLLGKDHLIKKAEIHSGMNIKHYLWKFKTGLESVHTHSHQLLEAINEAKKTPLHVRLDGPLLQVQQLVKTAEPIAIILKHIDDELHIQEHAVEQNNMQAFKESLAREKKLMKTAHDIYSEPLDKQKMLMGTFIRALQEEYHDNKKVINTAGSVMTGCGTVLGALITQQMELGIALGAFIGALSTGFTFLFFSAHIFGLKRQAQISQIMRAVTSPIKPSAW